MRAAASMASGDAVGQAGTGKGAPTTPPSSQQVSDGRMSVAVPPGAPRAACTAAAQSAPTVAACDAVRTQADTPRAKPSVSAVSGASSGRWCVAWSPTRLTMGERARRALCRLASPFARPGPQCSRVAAGRSCIRA